MYHVKRSYCNENVSFLSQILIVILIIMLNCTKNILVQHTSLIITLIAIFTGGLLAGAVLLGPFQGHVSHALYWLWAFPAPEPDRHVAHNALHDQRGHLLRNVLGPCNQPHSELGLIKKAIQREG